jgi:hypothetical protein
MDLKIKISPSEKSVFQNIDKDALEKIYRDNIEHNNYCCSGCGYRVLNIENVFKTLQIHVAEENKDKPEESKFTVLCKPCHATQHIDKAIENGWVNIVNSSFSQKNLIEICRINSVIKYLNDGEIRILKMKPEEYLYKLEKGELSPENKIKVIFTNKFEWPEF